MPKYEDEKIQIGRIFAAKRIKLQLTYYQVHKHTGIQINQIKSIENGIQNYTIESFLSLVEFYNLKLELQ